MVARRGPALPTRFLLPDGPRRGIVVNLAERRLFYFPARGGSVTTFPVGVAVGGLNSPLGNTRIIRKEANPPWYPPPSICSERPGLPRVIRPGPDDPLGAYALVLGWPDYLIHGTNKPDGVGRNVSHGCLHLYPEDIAALYRAVPVGTPVRVISEEADVQWADGALFVAAYPNKRQADALDSGDAVVPELPPKLVERVAAAAGNRDGGIDWQAVERAGLARSGIPIEVVPTGAADPTVPVEHPS